MFSELGVPTFDADKIGHALLESDEEIKTKIVETFGNRILVGHKISRKDLGEIVFANSRKKTQLESILHPAIINALNKNISNLINFSYAVVEAALIYEAELEGDFDYIILVKADRSIAVERAAKSHGIKREDMAKRLRTQISQSEKEKLADFVIANNGSLEELRNRVHLLHSVILSVAKQPAGS